MAQKYVPERLIVNGEYASVQRWIAHPPGAHSGSPIRDELSAVECITARGSRWFGGTHAFIDSSLRMVIDGYDGAESTSWELRS